jgi:hypothetical protein
MGRITPSFRHVFHQAIFNLQKKKGFYHTLKEPGHQQAFVSLVRVLSSEYAAMWNSGIFCVEDIMNLMMNIHVRAVINELEWRINQLERELEEYLEPTTTEKKDASTQRSETITDTRTMDSMTKDNEY